MMSRVAVKQKLTHIRLDHQNQLQRLEFMDLEANAEFRKDEYAQLDSFPSPVSGISLSTTTACWKAIQPVRSPEYAAFRVFLRATKRL
jgi:hypothetical protein